MDLPDQLAKAAQDGDAATVARLLAGGAEADARNTDRRTPLELAVRAGRAETVRLLLAAGADPGGEAGEYEDLTPMLMAAMYPDAEVVGILLDAGAPVGPQGEYGLAPLPVAATSGDEGYPHLVVQFLDRGHDIDVVMRDRTALELALVGGKWRMARWLLRRGAKPTEYALSAAYRRGKQSPEDEAVYRPLFSIMHASLHPEWPKA
ncbi:ankyrin repeat domain-containing protein [Streptomyces sp. NBC_00193]|uniref:ankyrin repeat domain-containing protein n=1 Tax=unclassified Streptomyces TaxID=2593676 RepID=UPI002257E79A|nr:MULTISPECIES: ankyrin repeat domain-containing protein [unclassified Streptomyces]MCX5123151.1 ankyrin repeat domain-containing protein [Streptomyces sp. NBC_00347]MCX5296497.1 ankyrin repeat domain-containing protein [Streptomyces sp. NBC_00193]